MSENQKYSSKKWLPTTVKEAKQRGWDMLDVVLFTGDAYIDHPSFGAAVIGRLLEHWGLKVAIVPQPNWQDDLRDFKKFGVPRLFFGVTSGCMDSMVNHYTANKRRRSDDAYTPGGKAGFRPDYAVSVYSRILKKIYPNTPIILGGIEASLRRFVHYDYWSNQLMPSILYSSKADLLVYGMGEKPLAEIVRLLEKGVPINKLQTVEQTAFLLDSKEKVATKKEWETLMLNDYSSCLSDKKKYALNFKVIEEESNKQKACRLVQVHNDKRVVVNPAYLPMSEKELDRVYDFPYTRLPHPKYHNKPMIPAYQMIRHSINIHRGCFGGCSFCTISAHQGKFIVSRSKKSIMKEVEQLTQMPDFKGYVSDVGGPSANMWKMQGQDLSICERCKRPSCLFPKICKNLDTNHAALIDLYKEIEKTAGVKKMFVASGIRYDFLDKKELLRSEFKPYISQVIKKHTSGRLKIAPEHTSEKVLKLMRKPNFELFDEFTKLFHQVNKKCGLNQQLIPYFISSHPDCNEQDMAELAVKTKQLNFRLEQVQDFTPTPMTLATVIYYSGINPYTQKEVFTAKSQQEKKGQKQFFFLHKSQERKKIIGQLKKMKRMDLIKQLFS